MPRPPRAVLAHAPAAVAFALLALAWTFPLVLHLTTHVPGAGAGDNVSFVWNLWWARASLRLCADPFYTTYLFYPVGTNLAQHTHTAFSGALAATVLAPLSPVAAQNVILLVWVFLNGFVAYLLAYRVSSHRLGALCAGVVFGGCPAVVLRLSGHFNLLAAWVLPLSMLLALRAFDRQSRRSYAAAGAAWALAAYCDSYYLAYVLIGVVLLVATRWVTVSCAVRRHPTSRLSRLFASLLALDVGLTAIVILTGGFEWGSAPLRVSMHTTFNLRIAFWALAGFWWLSRWRMSMRPAWRPTASIRADLHGLLAAMAVFGAAILPLAFETIRLVAAGDYTTQSYLWRSAPAGIDLASLVLGNPAHPVYGLLTRRAYAALGMNPLEGVGYLGVLAPALVLAGWRRLAHLEESRMWRLTLLVFGIWALGPFLNVCSLTPGVVLPAVLVRFVPLLSNARIPGRAIIVASLALSVLLALRLAQIAGTWSTARKTVVVAALLFEVATAPVALCRLEPGALYLFMARQPEPGAVLELPLGLRDGLREVGSLDQRTLYQQTVSGRPMLGGFAARLAPRVWQWYEREPVISTLLRLSDREGRPEWTPPPSSPAEAYQVMSRLSIRYVVLNREAASPALVRYAYGTLPLRRIGEDEGRELFEVQKPGGGGR